MSYFDQLVNQRGVAIARQVFSGATLMHLPMQEDG